MKDILNVQNTQYSQSGEYGGSKFVWVKGVYTQRIENGATLLNYPAAGGYVPCASLAHVDLKDNNGAEQNQCKVVYAFAVAAVADSDDVVAKVEKGSFVPTVGMILGKCPASLTAKTAGVAVTGVKEVADGYEITFASPMGALTTNDFLVEVEKAGTTQSLAVTKPNTFIGEEMYFDAAGVKGVELGADPYSTPLYVHNTAYAARMPKYPAIFLAAVNKSKIDGIVEI